MTIIAYILVIYLILYCGFLLKVTVACSKKEEVLNENYQGQISVLVPFRNEAGNIKACIDSILAQKTEIDFELILINDHSEDDYVNQISQSEKVTLIHLDESEKGKKQALTKGVLLAKGDVILTTDADCVVPDNWIESISKNFVEDKIQMSLGSVYIKENKTFVSLIQSSESLILGLFTKYGVVSGSPLLASGANLAFRKNAFKEVKGFFGNENISSGDDMFLLEKIRSHFGSESISFHNVETTTDSVNTMTEFLNQRVRWFKKMRYIKELRTTHFSFFISGLNSSILFAMIFPSFHSMELIVVLLTKYSIDLYVLSNTRGSTKKHLLFSPIFFVWNLIYPIVILVAMAIIKPKWKGRELS